MPLPDVIAPGVRLLFIGINPGMRTVAVGAPFANRSNRFYPALHRAGILDRVIDAYDGLTPVDRAYILSRGIGITSLVERGTPRATDLADDELRDAVPGLVERVARYRPAVAAFLGVSAYRIAFGSPKAVVGSQPQPLGETPLWIVPNPSGLNAHETVDSLAAAYRQVAAAAGIELLD